MYCLMNGWGGSGGIPVPASWASAISSKLQIERCWLLHCSYMSRHLGTCIADHPYCMRHVGNDTGLNLAFHSLLRWKITYTPPIPTISLKLFKMLGKCTFWTWDWKCCLVPKFTLKVIAFILQLLVAIFNKHQFPVLPSGYTLFNP